MEVWTVWFFKQQRCHKQREEEQGEHAPKGTREDPTSVDVSGVLVCFKPLH